MIIGKAKIIIGDNNNATQHGLHQNKTYILYNKNNTRGAFEIRKMLLP